MGYFFEGIYYNEKGKFMFKFKGSISTKNVVKIRLIKKAQEKIQGLLQN